MEKQKMVFHYGIREKQLRNYVRNAKKATDMPWIDSLIIKLESRLDNVVFRLNFSPSMASARQLVVHGHVRVNGKKVDVPNFTVKTGDKVTLSAKGYQSGNYLQGKENPRMVTPAFLSKEVESGNEIGRYVAKPDPKDIPFQFNNQLLTEYYWKI
jgi:small subunit ribosomal protein S4